MTRYGNRAGPSYSLAWNERVTRGSRRTRAARLGSKNDAKTISSPSRPAQHRFTCGLPSRFIVTTWAQRPAARNSRTLSGTVAMAMIVQRDIEVGVDAIPTGHDFAFACTRIVDRSSPSANGGD